MIVRLGYIKILIITYMKVALMIRVNIMFHILSLKT